MKSAPWRALRALTASLVLFIPLFACATAGAGAPREAAAGQPARFVPLAAAITQQASLTAPGVANDQYGMSVAVDGDTLAVGCVEASGDGSVYVYTRSGAAWTLQQRLQAADGTTNGSLGFSLAIAGDTIVAGDNNHGVGPLALAGAIYIWKRTNGVWAQQAQFAGDTGGDFLGWSVAIDGDTVVAGASSGTAPTAGYAAVYVRSGDTWSRQQKLASGAYRFGQSVAIQGDVVVVGAPGSQMLPTVAGSARVYTRSGGTWSAQQTLTASNQLDSDQFGAPLALDGDTLLVGAPIHNTVGAVYVFTGAGASWTQRAQLDGPSLRSGSAVALSNGIAAIGSTTAEAGGVPNAGEVALYSGAGATWTKFADATAATPAATDLFAHAVALSGPLLVVGAPNRVVDGLAGRGAADVFVLDSAPPVTTPSTSPAPTASGWNNGPVTVTLAASDTTSAVASVQYRLVGATDWITYPGPFVVSAAGVSQYECRATDAAGNVESPVAFSVKIDTSKPTTKARSAAAKKGKKVKLRFEVRDATPTCGQAAVTIGFFKGRKLKKTISVGVKPVNARQTFTWKCALRQGTYKLKVFATDIAGNVQSKAGSAKFTVD